jgi:hypothetical protein
MVYIRAQSPLINLERRRIAAEMMSDKPVADALSDALGDEPYELDEAFDGLTLSGFVPEQTVRERLQWICFVIGAYVRTSFARTIEIKPLGATERTIPMEKTYWKPSIGYRDYVTALKATYYSFASGTPSTTDKWVKDANGNAYVVTAQTLTLANNNVPAWAQPNELKVDGIMLINESNVSGILSHLAEVYFNRVELTADVLSNGQYKPGQKCLIYADTDDLKEGYIKSTDYAFGVQAKSQIKMVAVADIESASLNILYVWDTEGMQIGRRSFRLPVGYEYAIDNPYIEQQLNSHRYVFRPINDQAVGTVLQEGQTVTEQEAVALDLHNGILSVISVDGIEVDEEGKGTIA